MPEPVQRRKRSLLLSALLGGAALLVVIGIVRSPGEAFRASLSGLDIWWKQVFPGLIPPMILAELLAASGILHALAVLAEPLTRALFRLPGAAGWAVAFGWAAGVPAGAKETARLREAGLIRESDTETLLLVSHVPNPFLIVIIAGAGFLQSPALGWAIAAGVWLAALLTGILWPRITRAPRDGSPPRGVPAIPQMLLPRAVRAAGEARKADGRPLGKQLADGVTHAVGTLMSIGGLMMMVSVVLCLIRLAVPGSDVWLAVPGLYEMHLGAYESGRSPLLESAPAQSAALLAAALAWTGWSGLLQARAAFGGSAAFPWMRLIAGKLLHGALALLITYPLARAALSGGFSFLPSTLDLPVGAQAVPVMAGGGSLWTDWRVWPEIWLSGLACIAVFLLLALAAALIRPKPRRPKP
jgi:sporulation integral membrane protein YlbJ